MHPLQWKSGTAFDLFVSLVVLHHPALFGLRPNWAAGVRQRLPVPYREFLEKFYQFGGVPLPWMVDLDQPLDASSVLRAVSNLEPSTRLTTLAFTIEAEKEVRETLAAVSAAERWRNRDLETLTAELKKSPQVFSEADLRSMLEMCSHASESGELLLNSLQAYYQVFFKEEEARILPVLDTGLSQAKELARRLDVPALIDELSHGVRFEPPDLDRSYCMIPSYWSSPLIFYSQLKTGALALLFGVRPGLDSLEPGTTPPGAVVGSLKALADPSRLRILRLLAGSPLTSSELAKQLRLRLPTVTHHLRLLRLAGLVQITVGETEKKFATRLDSLEGMHASLVNFIRSG